ncbi:hypothetical protein [Chthonobacter rhizosphaerae]|uniref:flagellin N-terminal helical domain-containing protein n=1 Tax=Chthonobacter rhizosphaerae TaxID=2735553 RepID=UPI0015EE7478|nr:hypothetical protein [Chthonobacter rhizosphaerae]
MAINNVALRTTLAQLTRMRGDLETLQQQLGSGKKADTYGGLGAQRSLSVSFRARVAEVESYTSTVDMVGLRVKLMDSTMTRLSAVPNDIRSAIDPNSYVLRQDGKTDAQKVARIGLDEVIGLLNAQADGRYLFAGTDAETRPVVDLNTMLEGDGSRYGLRRVTEDRLVADLGVQGMGRLEPSVAGPTATLGLQDPPSDVFGFKIASFENDLAGTTVAGDETTGLAVTFSGTPPSAGDTFRLSLTNPDGTSSSITLTATTADPPGDGEFAIGGDPDTTAANFNDVLTRKIRQTAKSDLSAASAVQAGREFFDTYGGAMPKRVDAASTDPADLASATGLRDATTGDTVQWYRGSNNPVVDGDPTTQPRNDVKARIDTNVDIAYGARANEEAFRTLVQSLATVAVAEFDAAETNDGARYQALMERSRDALAFDGEAVSPADVHAEIAVAAKVATDAKERHQVNKSVMLDMVDGVEGVTMEEVAAQILALRTRMEASYQATARISQLSLVNYL